MLRNSLGHGARKSVKDGRASKRPVAEHLERRSLLSASILNVGGDEYVVNRPAASTVDDTIDHGHDDGSIPGSGQGAAGFQITVHFTDASLTPSQQAIFNTAADRWEAAILGEISDITFNWGEGTQTVDDLHIDASAPFIDGVGGILGQAGFTHTRVSNGLPARGIMQFDSADVANLQAAGELDEVIVHEMGHVLGLGTLWSSKGLIVNPGTADPRYTGALATAQYQAIFGVATATVPVENTGGAGTADGHWREGGGAGVAFDRELMTGFLDGGVVNPLSRVSVAQMADLGYPSVNINAFDVFNPTNGGNAYPTITSLSDSPDPAPTNSNFTLTANGVADSNGTINAVRFYRETNNIPGLQILVGTVGDIQGDLLLGSDTSSAGGYTFNVSTTGLANGTYTYYAQATDNQNLVSVNVQSTHTVGGSASVTPGTPDLVAATDTGSSNSDDITNRDNSTGAKNLQFSVTGTVAGATVSIYSSGTLIGSAVASGATTTVTTDGTTDLADGARSITARQTESGKSESPDSAALSVTIDTLAPTVDVTDVSPDPRTTGVSSINVVFSQAVVGFDLADLALTRTSVNVPLTASQAPTTGDNVTFTVPNLLALTSINGTYQLGVGTTGITDVAGNALAGAASDTWVHSLPTWLTGGSNVTWNSQTKALTVNGNATINANPGADLPLVSGTTAAAVLTISPGASPTVVQLGSLSLTGGATANLTAFGNPPQTNNRHTLVIQNAGGLTVSGAGSKLNLNDNAAVLKGTALAAAETLLTNGYNSGAWNGNGIVSGTAAADGTDATALGYASGAQLAVGTFHGVSGIAAGDVLIRHTYNGDTNLDGLVNTDDVLNILSAGTLDVNTASSWFTGDFNFSDRTDTDDILLLLTSGRLDA